MLNYFYTFRSPKKTLDLEDMKDVARRYETIKLAQFIDEHFDAILSEDLEMQVDNPYYRNIVIEIAEKVMDDENAVNLITKYDGDFKIELLHAAAKAYFDHRENLDKPYLHKKWCIDNGYAVAAAPSPFELY